MKVHVYAVDDSIEILVYTHYSKSAIVLLV